MSVNYVLMPPKFAYEHDKICFWKRTLPVVSDLAMKGISITLHASVPAIKRPSGPLPPPQIIETSRSFSRGKRKGFFWVHRRWPPSPDPPVLGKLRISNPARVAAPSSPSISHRWTPSGGIDLWEAKVYSLPLRFTSARAPLTWSLEAHGRWSFLASEEGSSSVLHTGIFRTCRSFRR